MIRSKPMRFVLVMSVALAACAHPAPAPTAPAGPDAVERQRAEANVAWLEGKRTAICACDDAACVRALTDEIGDWMPAHFGEARLDDGQRQRLRDGAQQLQACQAATSAPPTSSSAHAIDELRDLETQMCACKDAACVQRVSQEMETVGAKYADTKASESEIKAAAAIVERIVECATRAAES